MKRLSVFLLGDKSTQNCFSLVEKDREELEMKDSFDTVLTLIAMFTMGCLGLALAISFARSGELVLCVLVTTASAFGIGIVYRSAELS